MYPRLTPPRPADEGLSLVELLVAIVLLSIAVVGLFRVFDHGLATAQADRERLLAGIVARNRAEELQLGELSLPDRTRFAGRDWAIETLRQDTTGGFDQTRITVRPSEGGAGTRLVTYVGVERR